MIFLLERTVTKYFKDLNKGESFYSGEQLFKKTGSFRATALMDLSSDNYNELFNWFDEIELCLE